MVMSQAKREGDEPDVFLEHTGGTQEGLLAVDVIAMVAGNNASEWKSKCTEMLSFLQCLWGHEAELLMHADFYAIIIYIKC